MQTTLVDLVQIMSEGNPGAISVIMQIAQRKNGFITLLHLDDMNIRGCQIWVGYKDYCKENIDDFIKAINERNPDMINEINKKCLCDNFSETAVTSGASFKNI